MTASRERFHLLVRDQFIALLRKFGHSLTPSTPLDEVLTTYFNWHLRRIAPQPRTVLKSQVFLQRTLRPEHARVADNIVSMCERGEDINSFQSAALSTKAAAHDMMLNHWGVHHLHFDQLKKGRRSSELLFAIVRPTELLVLDVGTHQSFSDQDLMEVVHAEYPHFLRQFKTGESAIDGGDRRGKHALTNGQIASLRNRGIGTLLTMRDGTQYMAGAFVATGLPISARIYADRVSTKVTELADIVDQVPEQLMADVAPEKLADATPVFEPHVQFNEATLEDIWVAETITKTGIRVNVSGRDLAWPPPAKW
jgi:hypothetical protein